RAIGAADGDDGRGPADVGRALPGPGRGRGALGEVHGGEDRAGLRWARLLRQRCDEGPRPGEQAGRRAHARGDGGTGAGRAGTAARRQRGTAVENEVLAAGAVPACAVYKCFPVQSEGDAIVFLGPDRRVIETFTFPRQSSGEGLCLADFVAPRSTGTTDYVALFV